MLCIQGKDSEAEREVRRAVELAELAGLDPLTRCNAFLNLGEVLRTQGKYGEVERLARRVAELAEQANLDALTRCHAVYSLGEVLRDQGQHDVAEQEARPPPPGQMGPARRN